MRLRRPSPGVVALLAWLLAVVVTAGIAGRSVAVMDTPASRPGVMSPAEVDRALAAARATLGPTPRAGVVTVAPNPVPTPATPPPVGGGPTPSAAPVGPAAVARTWSTDGGTVGASCLGAAISLLFATPADGWTVEVGAAGPEHLEVELKQPGRETTIVAVCADGVPQQTTGRGSSEGAEPSDD